MPLYDVDLEGMKRMVGNKETVYLIKEDGSFERMYVSEVRIVSPCTGIANRYVGFRSFVNEKYIWYTKNMTVLLSHEMNEYASLYIDSLNPVYNGVYS